MDGQECLSTPVNPGVDRQVARREDLFQNGPVLGIQQHPDKRRRSLESRVQDEPWKFRTIGYVLRLDQFPGYVADNDERDIPRPDRQRGPRGLHGRLTGVHKDNERTPRSRTRGSQTVARKRPVPQVRKVLLRTRPMRIPGSHHQQGWCTHGPKESQWSTRLAETHQGQRTTRVLRFRQLLPTLRQGLREESCTTARLVAKRNRMELGS